MPLRHLPAVETQLSVSTVSVIGQSIKKAQRAIMGIIKRNLYCNEPGVTEITGCIKDHRPLLEYAVHHMGSAHFR